MEEKEFNNKIRKGEIEEVKEEDKDTKNILDKKEEDFTPQLNSLRRSPHEYSAVPTHKPKSFLEHFVFYTSGGINRLYVWINSAWRKLTNDHGDMDGLADDDHPQYIKADGTRDFSGTGAGFKDEDDMTSDSATAIASQQSIKAYVDSLSVPNPFVLPFSPMVARFAADNLHVQTNYSPVSYDFVTVGKQADLTGGNGVRHKRMVIDGSYATVSPTTDVSIGANGDIKGVCRLGSYIYVSVEEPGATDMVYQYDLAWANEKASQELTNGYNGPLATDGTYLYMLTDSTHIRKYSIAQDNGTITLTLESTKEISTDIDQAFYCDGTYYYGYYTTDYKVKRYVMATGSEDNTITLGSSDDPPYIRGLFLLDSKIYVVYAGYVETDTGVITMNNIYCVPIETSGGNGDPSPS